MSRRLAAMLVVVLALAVGVSVWLTRLSEPQPLPSRPPPADPGPAPPPVRRTPTRQEGVTPGTPSGVPAGRAPERPVSAPPPAVAPVIAPVPASDGGPGPPAAAAPEPGPPSTPAAPYPASRDGIRAAINSIKDDVRDCYQQWFKHQPSLEGKMVITFTIEDEGDGVGVVRRLGARDGGMDHVLFQGCVLNAFSGLRFEPPAGGELTVNYPFTFHAADGG